LTLVIFALAPAPLWKAGVSAAVALPAALFLALLVWLLPYLFLLRAIKLVGASRASLVSVAELPLTLLLAFLLLGERMVPLQIPGALLIVIGVVMSGEGRSPAEGLGQ
jgi:drug/metabolite transporter (DMT)-like permease